MGLCASLSCLPAVLSAWESLRERVTTSLFIKCVCFFPSYGADEATLILFSLLFDLSVDEATLSFFLCFALLLGGRVMRVSQ